LFDHCSPRDAGGLLKFEDVAGFSNAVQRPNQLTIPKAMRHDGLAMEAEQVLRYQLASSA
jgi:hypothetical protein